MGPEVESEWINFDALNIGARSPGPLDAGHLLRDVRRTRASCCAPTPRRCRSARCWPAAADLRGVPGRVYRTDELDATHTPVFHQVEGLAVDEGITMADLKGTLDHFAGVMFGEGIVTRLRPLYFPFTEPSRRGRRACFACRGASVGDPDRPCRTCSSEGWIEWGGCGMVNPRVLRACGIDPERLLRLRVRHGPRAHPDVPPRDHRHARHRRGRRAVHPHLRNGDLMRVPLSWLREHVELPAGLSAREVAAGLVRVGLEVETVEEVAPGLTGPLVVGRVGGDRGVHREQRKTIRFCRVDVGAPTPPTACAASSAARRTSPSATSSSWCCPGPSCPAASRSRRARRTGTSPTG